MSRNETVVTIRGNLAADPEHRRLDDGSDVVSFRIGSTSRHFRDGRWVDGATSWYSVSAWRSLGLNCQASLRKGQPVVVHGRLVVREWTDVDANNQPRSGRTVDVDALTVGHDLTLGSAEFRRVVRVERFERPGQEEVDEVSDRLAGRFDGLPAVDADGVLVDPSEDPARV